MTCKYKTRKNPHAMVRAFVRRLLVLAALSGTVAHAQLPDHLADFELNDLDGKPHTLSEYGTQPKLIMFWATWCPYCKILFPAIKDIHRQHAAEGLAVLAISVRDDGDVAAYIEEYGLKMPVLVEGDDVADSLGVPGTPAVLVLDADNRIVYATTNSDPQAPGIRRAISAVLP